MAMRRISTLLPEVLQTDVNKNFFAATGDQLFTPENVEYIDAYVGEKPVYGSPNDVYVAEQSADRQNYQMEATSVSKEFDTNTVTNILFYNDLLNRINWQGGDITDPNRLFEAEYYSWGVPFDVDKFVNYTNYVWLPYGPNAITLLNNTNSTEITGATNYTYTGKYYLESDPLNIITGSLNFTTGLRVVMSADINQDARTRTYVIEGVGRAIQLVPDTIPDNLAWNTPLNWDSDVWDNPTVYSALQYLVMGRGSLNQNPWSLCNRWFHVDLLAITGTLVSDINSVSGRRPILEFDRDLELFNFGTQGRAQVNFVDTTTQSLNTVNGTNNAQVNGIALDDGMRVLFTSLTDPLVNNRIYAVTNLRNGGEIVLQPVANGSDPTGAPLLGDCVGEFQHPIPELVSDPNYSRARESNWIINWWYNGSSWIQAQSRDPLIQNQAPLFNLYDSEGVSLSDPGAYPLSNFAGSTLFRYQIQAGNALDSILGLAVVPNPAQPNDLTFENTLVTDEVNYQNLPLQPQPIIGLKSWKTTNAVTGQEFFANNWFTSPCLSRQYVVNQSYSTIGQTTIVLDQVPSLEVTAGPPAVEITVAGNRLRLNQDYTVSNNVVALNLPLDADQLITARSWNQFTNTATNGYFEIPRNLEANPLNGDIETVTRSELLAHFTSVVANQSVISWRDSAQNQGLGTVILQHRAPLLRLMMLNSLSQTNVITSTVAPLDPIAVMQWAQREYLRFYNKFVNSLINIFNAGAYTGAETTTAWINKALSQVNLAKTPASPWANSGFDGVPGAYCSVASTSPTYVPTTATRLGVTPAWQPLVFLDHSQPSSPLSMRCHNGAIVVMKDSAGDNLGDIIGGAASTSDPALLSHPIARAWLQFELLMFTNLPAQYGAIDALLMVDTRTIFSGKWRKTNYSNADRNLLLHPIFERWSVENQLDALKNTTVTLNDPFSWNYGAMRDRDGQSVPGNWRGIYNFYYDTDQPHLTPWAMLGFTQQPLWWEAQYGAAPYTSGNLLMWQDLRDGVIREGARAGTYPQWARPGLLDYIPVDEGGNLLPPFQAGIVANEPSWFQARADWQWGDMSPIEYVWSTTVDYDFVLAQITYLAKPAQFVEYLWDPTRTQQIFSTQSNAQWISTDTQARKSPSECFVQRENPQTVSGYTGPSTTATYYGSGGIQQWISEYLVGQNQSVTTYFGAIMRGCGVQLGYRLGGFTNGDTLRMKVDSFGLSTNDSLLIPQEDASVQLYRAGVQNEIFYSGVIVESMGSTGWRVIGYDVVNPVFTIIPSRTTGAKTTIVVDNVRVIQYQTGQNFTQEVAYGTVFADRQGVYDFLISLGRYQIAQGWVFDGYASASSSPQDWALSAREFLFWSQGTWAAGTFIALSPLANKISYTTTFGMIGYAGGIVNGCYSLLDRGGRAIDTRNVDFLRLDNTITVRTLGDQGIYGLRLYASSIEHTVLFNNGTIFGDTVYNPLLDVRQDRIKLLAMRTLDWNGRLEAPGYIVTQTSSTVGDLTTISNGMFANFEKSVSDLASMYDIDVPTTYQVGSLTNQVSKIAQASSPEVQALARHLIAYQPRDYLTNLLVDDNTQFQFYQGMIQQKGTANSIDALLRDTSVLNLNESFDYYEEFAFKTGDYGAVAAIKGMDIILDQSLFTSDPQIVELLGSEDWDNPADNTITVVPGSTQILTATPNLVPWTTRTQYGAASTDLPTAGYVLMTEAKYTVVDDAGLQSLWKIQNSTTLPLASGDVIWKFIDTLRVWDVYKFMLPTWGISSSAVGSSSNTTTITTNLAHNLPNNTWVVIQGLTTSETVIQDTYQIFNVTSLTFDIQTTTASAGSGGTINVYFSKRFQDFATLSATVSPDGWYQGDLVYVDGTRTSPWTVYSNQGTWVPVRTEELKVDTSLIKGSRLYNKVSLSTLSNLTLWDPIKAAVPAFVSQEIQHKTPYDPASYNTAGTITNSVYAQQSWGMNEVGIVWWDLSTTRFIDYETGTNSYRRQYWGQIAPGTTVDVYEWIRSLVPPASWAGAVATGNANVTGDGSIPSGSVKGTLPNYVQTSEQNAAGAFVPVYYFWVKGMKTIPAVSFRAQSTLTLGNMIAQPQNLGISWWAPISTTAALLGNISSSLNAATTVWQINWATLPENGLVHREWTLARPGDPRSSPPASLWEKMRVSLVGRDDVGNQVPDLKLSGRAQLGIGIRPAQSMFADLNSSRRAFVRSVNTILANSTIPPAFDSDRLNWQSFFESGEPLPSQYNSQLTADLATTAPLLAVYNNGDAGVGAVLTALSVGSLTVDGVAAEIGDGILVKNGVSNQIVLFPSQAQNGIYTVVSQGSSTGYWSLRRDSAFNTVEQMVQATVQVKNGTANAGKSWNQTNQNIAIIGLDPVVFEDGIASANWARQVGNLSELYSLSGELRAGDSVLVLSNANTNNRWTMWTAEANSVAQNESSWTLSRQQSWNTSACWSYVDWYAVGFSSSTAITWTAPTLAQRDAFTGYNEGDIVLVANTGNAQWAMYQYSAFATLKFTLVGQQNGGIQLSDNLWNDASYGLGYNGGNFNQDYQGWDFDYSVELNQIIQGIWPNASGAQGLLKIDVLNQTNEYNQVFFDMINHVLAEQNFVDWLFKTSFINLRGFNQPLATSVQYQNSADITDNLMGYINEVKPYRAQVREFVQNYVSTDIWNGTSTDFDTSADAGLPQVRSIKTTMAFDRVGCSVDGTLHAADRIAEYYAPTDDMLPADSANLISGCAPSGQTLDGQGLLNVGRWDQFNWDTWQPWDETSEDFERFFDLVVQGGVAPSFWRLTGNGAITSFALPQAPQNPGGLKVWVNGKLLKSPKDWTIPNFVASVSVLAGGVGYSVNDRILLSSSTSQIPAQLLVTDVGPTGAIEAVQLLEMGVYQPEPDQMSIFAQGGTGLEALFAVSWGGTALNFALPPEASNQPNIWIMQAGNSFEPAPLDILSTIWDGGAMARINSEGGHPEELMLLRNRDQFLIKVGSAPVGGVSPVQTQSFACDGITDQFPLGQPCTALSTIIVSHNGKNLTQGALNDYVINLDTQRVVFVQPPSLGTVNIITIQSGTPAFTQNQFSIANKNAEGAFVLGSTPSGAEAVMVKVNGLTINPYWDYTVSVEEGVWQVTVHTAAPLVSSDQITAIYPTGAFELPPVAFGLFSDLSGNTIWSRIGNQATTTLAQDCLYNSLSIVVEDGTNLPTPSAAQAGVVWINNERVEYWNKSPLNAEPNSLQTVLSGLTRGSKGTSGGVASVVAQQFWSGNGISPLFRINLLPPIVWRGTVNHTVISNGVTMNKGKDYTVVENPAGFASGAYLQFESGSIPAAGVNNIVIILNRQDSSQSNLSHAAGTKVVSGGAEQTIEGGIPFLTGTGLQRSNIPQAIFLLNAPGTLSV